MSIIEVCPPVVRPYVVYRQTPMAQDILDVVASFYEIPVVALLSRRRAMDVTRPRQIAAYLMTQMTTLSHSQIGGALGDRDHTTILHAMRKIESLLETSDRLRDEVQLLRMKIADFMNARNRARKTNAAD